ncbi:hypothetical protein SORDD14_00905 [Streptococcus oralis]|uniref:Uroporphyrinogen decarboxylase (URO-D) domain-containing protein n=1 Tax=Streptococcus oralis TaxID=1303 RepID=A0A139P1R3_STROR|nr:uroporphyrinogen decarboxylase family protein [Streptococcus oralis]KXT82201.1 hypothetical protein SORDD14_00905 [Streptococcus oralis]
MSEKRERVLKAFKGEAVDRVPIGFWHHFTEESEWLEGFSNPKIIEKNLKGHKTFIKELDPDFVKLMSDGYFAYPNPVIGKGKTIQELGAIKPLGADHPWIQEQVDLVKKIKADFPEDIVAIYNIFAPITYLKWLVGKVAGGDDEIASYLAEDKATLKKVLDVIAQDIAALSKRIIQEAGADGIYLSVQSIQGGAVSVEDYQEIIAPSEVAVLEAANEVGGINILHICGYEGARNDIHIFADYPAQVFNWAVGPEGISLSEGREIFKGRTVLGGFENGKSGLLYTGSKEEIQAETKRLIAESGKEGLIIGADCTVPSDIAVEHLQWVKEATL